MAGSLESTVPGEPTDVVDVDTESLPLPADEVGEVKQSLQSSQGTTGERMDAQELQDDGDEQSAQSADGDGESQRADSAGERSSGGAADRAASAAASTQEPARSLLEYLLPALALLAVLAAVLYRREWLLERLRASLGPDEEPADAGEPALLSVRSPDNEVERCWLEMVSRVDQSGDPSATPRERAEAVARAGLDREAVEDLTGLYESVRYGDRPVTDALVDEASHLRRSAGESDD